MTTITSAVFVAVDVLLGDPLAKAIAFAPVIMLPLNLVMLWNNDGHKGRRSAKLT